MYEQFIVCIYASACVYERGWRGGCVGGRERERKREEAGDGDGWVGEREKEKDRGRETVRCCAAVGGKIFNLNHQMHQKRSQPLKCLKSETFSKTCLII